MEQIVIYLLMVQKLLNLKQKTLATPLSLENISKDWSMRNGKKGTNLDSINDKCGYVYDFSVDFNAFILLVIHSYIFGR